MFNRSFRPAVAAFGLSIALMLATALPASAAKPTKTEFSFSFTGAQITDICAFPISLDGTQKGTQTDFVNNDGALIRSSQHIVQQDTFYANGKTLVGIPYTYDVEIFFDSNGTMTKFLVFGVFEKIPLPDGSLFISAGKIIRDLKVMLLESMRARRPGSGRHSMSFSGLRVLTPPEKKLRMRVS